MVIPLSSILTLLFITLILHVGSTKAVANDGRCAINGMKLPNTFCVEGFPDCSTISGLSDYTPIGAKATCSQPSQKCCSNSYFLWAKASHDGLKIRLYKSNGDFVGKCDDGVGSLSVTDDRDIEVLVVAMKESCKTVTKTQIFKGINGNELNKAHDELFKNIEFVISGAADLRLRERYGENIESDFFTRLRLAWMKSNHATVERLRPFLYSGREQSLFGYLSARKKFPKEDRILYIELGGKSMQFAFRQKNEDPASQNTNSSPPPPQQPDENAVDLPQQPQRPAPQRPTQPAPQVPPTPPRPAPQRPTQPVPQARPQAKPKPQRRKPKAKKTQKSRKPRAKRRSKRSNKSLKPASKPNKRKRKKQKQTGKRKKPKPRGKSKKKRTLEKQSARIPHPGARGTLSSSKPKKLRQTQPSSFLQIDMKGPSRLEKANEFAQIPQNSQLYLKSVLGLGIDRFTRNVLKLAVNGADNNHEGPVVSECLDSHAILHEEKPGKVSWDTANGYVWWNGVLADIQDVFQIDESGTEADKFLTHEYKGDKTIVGSSQPEALTSCIRTCRTILEQKNDDSGQLSIKSPNGDFKVLPAALKAQLKDLKIQIAKAISDGFITSIKLSASPLFYAPYDQTRTVGKAFPNEIPADQMNRLLLDVSRFEVTETLAPRRIKMPASKYSYNLRVVAGLLQGVAEEIGLATSSGEWLLPVQITKLSWGKDGYVNFQAFIESLNDGRLIDVYRDAYQPSARKEDSIWSEK